MSAIEWLIAGDLPVLHALRQQFACAVPVRRQVSSAGSFTQFRLTRDDLPKINPPTLKLSALDVELPGGPNGSVGFMLILSMGKIAELEAFTYADPMPDLAAIDVERCSFAYTDNRRGDLLSLSRAVVYPPE